MIDHSHVGKKVKLNDSGIEQIWGEFSSNSLQHMKTLEMVVTEMGDVSLCSPEQVFEVRVNNPDINQYMIDNWCFDPVDNYV